ncbi:hypothetical protein JXR01_01715 [Candidatus Kaiserbacteria bacterium]|nr:MAG: hypothetical protein JXR01_01715 [Candidatus Kaiserbacteria bacterium]
MPEKIETVPQKKSISEKIQAFRLQSTFNKYHVLFDIMRRLPRKDNGQVLEAILPSKFKDRFFNALKSTSLLSNEYIRKREGKRQLTEALLENAVVIDDIKDLAHIPLTQKELRNEIRAIALKLILLVSNKTDKHTDIILSLISLDLTPEDLKNLPRHVKKIVKENLGKYELSLTKGSDWHLCSDAEPRLNRALDDNAFLLVNEKLLVKFNGRMSALCLTDFKSKDGRTFKKGFWYAAEDKETREKLRQAFDGGDPEININHGNWVLIRAVKKLHINKGVYYGKMIDKEETINLVEKALRTVEQLPKHFPTTIHDQTTSRKEYRNIYKEKLNESVDEMNK